jgi:rRNA-processing protein FCF1
MSCDKALNSAIKRRSKAEKEGDVGSLRPSLLSLVLWDKAIVLTLDIALKHQILNQEFPYICMRCHGSYY